MSNQDELRKSFRMDLNVAIIEGRAFTFTDEGSIPSSGTVDYVFTPAFNTAISSFNVTTDTTDFITSIFKDSVSSSGSDIKDQIYQLNHIKPVISTTSTMVKDPTVSVAGTLIFKSRTLTDAIRQGNIVGASNILIPFVLDAGKPYRIELSNQIASIKTLIIQITGIII